jgi:hypothetical protein
MKIKMIKSKIILTELWNGQEGSFMCTVSQFKKNENNKNTCEK